MSDRPVIQITEPEVIKKENVTIFDYDESHVIYKTQDLGSFTELQKMKAMNQQQKEFIEYLENEIEALEFCDNEFILSNHKKEVKAYKEILLKYKEIIGKDINVSTK